MGSTMTASASRPAGTSVAPSSATDLRRRVREILRRRVARGGPGHDILIVMRRPATEATFDELRSTLERLLQFAHASAKADA